MVNLTKKMYGNAWNMHCRCAVGQRTAEENWGMEFYDVHFSYIDNDTLEEHFVSVKSRVEVDLFPKVQPNQVSCIPSGSVIKACRGLYRLELQVTKGSGKLATSGLWNSSSAKGQVKIAFDYFKANASRISGAVRCWNMISTYMG